MSDTKTNIYTRFLQAQQQFPNIAKDKKATAGRAGSYKYADVNDILAKVVPILNANGLSLIQRTTGTETSVSVETVIYSIDGEKIESGAFTVTTRDLMQKGCQAHGSATTYARRYSLVAFLGLAYGTPDDDGQEATRHYYEQPKPVAKQVAHSKDFNELEKLIKTASNVTEINNIVETIKLKTDMSVPEMNEIRGMWKTKRDQLVEQGL